MTPKPITLRRSRSVCILGGTGFVGSRLVTRLFADGHRVKVLTRNRERNRHLLVLPDVQLLTADVHDPRQLAQHFVGVDCVVNLVGVLNPRGGAAGFRRAHPELAGKVVRAARSSNVARLLHMSALGAHPQTAPSLYLRSKGEAEEVVRNESGTALRWVIFRPSIIFGPRDSFINRFARLLRIIPLAFPLARAGARIAPVHVGDVVEAIARCVVRDEALGETLELCGPEVFTLREIVEFTAETLGVRRFVIPLPDFVGRLQGAIMGLIPGSPFTLDNFRSLTVDAVCSTNGFARLGIAPHSMRPLVQQYLGRSSRTGVFDAYRSQAYGERA